MSHLWAFSKLWAPLVPCCLDKRGFTVVNLGLIQFRTIPEMKPMCLSVGWEMVKPTMEVETETETELEMKWKWKIRKWSSLHTRMVQRHCTCDLIYSAASYQSLAVLVAELWKIQSVAMTRRLRALADSATVVRQQHMMAIVKVGYLPQTQAFPSRRSRLLTLI